MKLGASILIALACVACDNSQTVCSLPLVWPEGTVLALGDRPIGAAEVDEAAGCIALLEPRDSFDQLRRLALTNIVLPRCAAQAIDPAARTEALHLAQEWKKKLDAGVATGAPAPGPLLTERKGYMRDLGFELWNAAMALEPGQWTGVVESPGCFQIARLKEKSAGALPGLVELTLQNYDFPYLPPDDAHKRIEAQLDRSRLVYVDESWRTLVPTAWQARLRGESP